MTPRRIASGALVAVCLPVAIATVSCGTEVAQTEPGSTFQFDPSHLLTDAELRTPDDRNAA